MILVTLQRIFRLRNIQTLIKLSLLQGSNKKNKGNGNQSYDGNLHILTFYSFTEHMKLINQMADFCTVEILSS